MFVPPEDRPVRVFLDSSDYSTLSDERRRTPELNEIRERLIQWADSGDVEFWYSGTVLIEMAPLSAGAVDASVARTELLVRLCNTQALISVDRILQYEFQNLSAEAPTVSLLPFYSYSGDWFPELTDVISPVSWLEGIREFDIAAKQQGLNRQSRRKLHKQLFKKGQPTTGFLGVLTQQKFAFDEISQQYPMREQDAEVLWDYVTGKASASQATEAFLASLRDPRWMVRWFYNNSDKLSPFTMWARSSSEGILQMIQQVSETVSGFKEKSKELRDMGAALGIVPKIPEIDAAWWLGQQNELVENLVQRIGAKLNAVVLNEPFPVNVDELAPSLATCIRVLHSSTWSSIGESARKPKKSDWLDCLHAMYAPYVDIFRTDSYMAPIIQEHAQKYGTTVVSKLDKLAVAIEDRIASKAG